MPMRFRSFQGTVALTLLGLMGGLAMVAIAVLTSPDGPKDFASIDEELATISEDAERIATFKRNFHKVRLDEPETRTVPFAGFIANANRLKPGREIELARNHSGNAKLTVLDVRRISQSINVARPSAMRMDLLLVRGRLVEGTALSSDQFLSDQDGPEEGRVINLLFAVGVPADGKAPSLSAPPLHQSL